MTKLELKQALESRENQFDELSIAGCISSCVMGNLRDVIGRIRIAIAELDLEEARANHRPMLIS